MYRESAAEGFMIYINQEKNVDSNTEIISDMYNYGKNISYDANTSIQAEL